MSCFKLQPNSWRFIKISLEHIAWEHIGWPWKDAMNNRTAFAKFSKWVNADRAWYVWLWSTIVVVILSQQLRVFLVKIYPCIWCSFLHLSAKWNVIAFLPTSGKTPNGVSVLWYGLCRPASFVRRCSSQSDQLEYLDDFWPWVTKFHVDPTDTGYDITTTSVRKLSPKNCWKGCLGQLQIELLESGLSMDHQILHHYRGNQPHKLASNDVIGCFQSAAKAIITIFALSLSQETALRHSFVPFVAVYDNNKWSIRAVFYVMHNTNNCLAKP